MTDAPFTFSPPLIAHRGARTSAPENTMAAFKAARDAGVRWIETDIKLTADGVPILFHDETLERTTNQRGAVAEASWADVQNADAGSWFSPAFAGARVPALSELLGFARDSDLRLNLELRPSPGRMRATAMVALIEVAKMWPESVPPPLISSFDVESLAVAAQLHPDWQRCLLMEEWRDDWQEVAASAHASSLNIKADLLTPPRLIELARGRMQVLAYTVNDPAQAAMLLGNGVKALLTDNPALLSNP